jgi:mono/diheme cytochrome c family protein/thiol-disulfide isomerase/thioredoxin
MVRKKLANRGLGIVTALGLAILGLIPSGMAAEARTVELRPIHGPDGRLVELKAPSKGAVVLVFYSSECPISNGYSPTLNRLGLEFPSERTRMVGVCVDPDLSDKEVETHAKDFALKFPIVRDGKGILAAKVGATVTPEAFVIDDAGRLRYHGRIDDQFAGRRKPNAVVATSELRDAVRAVLDGRDVAVEHVEAVGCPLPEHPKPASPPTYNGQVAVLLQRHCQECHRKGQVAPFALDTYEQARKRAADIASVVEDREMPPWKPMPGIGPKFQHSRALDDSAIAAIVAWSAAGAPLGDPAAAPAPARFPDDWVLGTPDLIVQPAEEFSIPADGADVYRCFVVPTNLPKDMYITAIEYQPANRKIVHHMLAYVDTSGEARKKDAEEPGPGYSCFSGPGVEIHGDLGGWAPGNEPSRLPEGIGRALPKGADVIVQVHYHPDGKTETDRSRIGLHFARAPIKQTLHWNAAVDLGLKIPAGSANHESRAAWPVPVDLVAYAVTPHMHLLGRDIQMSVTYPDGRDEDLIKIADWDFGWQNTYYFARPIDLPKGSVVKLVSHFDNSKDNPKNPNRANPIPVKWGEATTDEMSIGFIAVTKKGQDLTRPGAKDDLHEIFKRQRQEFEEEMRRKAKEAEAKR